MIKKGFLLASFAIGVFANIFAQDTLSFKKTRDKNIYVEFLGSSNLIGVSFDSRFTPISPWGYINPEKPDVPLNKNDAFQKVQKRRVQEKR